MDDFDFDYALVRLYGRIDMKENGCWEYNHFRNKCGYGVFSVAGKTTHASRASYIAHYRRELRHDEYVCHHCDNPACVNPEHLYVADQKTNMKHMVARGRRSQKLTWTQVRNIRERKRLNPEWMLKEISAEFSIAESMASFIVNNKKWVE